MFLRVAWSRAAHGRSLCPHCFSLSSFPSFFLLLDSLLRCSLTAHSHILVLSANTYRLFQFPLVQSPSIPCPVPSSFMQPELAADSHSDLLTNSTPRNPFDSSQHGHDRGDDHWVSGSVSHGLQDSAGVVVASSTKGQVHPSPVGRVSPDGMTRTPSPREDLGTTPTAMVPTIHPDVSLNALPNGMSPKDYRIPRHSY